VILNPGFDSIEPLMALGFLGSWRFNADKDHLTHQ
jgi:hypothetical protein